MQNQPGLLWVRGLSILGPLLPINFLSKNSLFSWGFPIFFSGCPFFSFRKNAKRSCFFSSVKSSDYGSISCFSCVSCFFQEKEEDQEKTPAFDRYSMITAA